MEVEMAHNLHRDYEQGRDRLSEQLRRLIERGRECKAIDYTRALAAIDPLNQALAAVFDEFDAILTPAAPGEAPRGLARTGNPVFCTIWTYLGVPAVTLPLLQSEAGLPLGVQLVGRRGNDARLLRTAHWLVETLGRDARGRTRKATAPGKADRARRRKGKTP
jgi:Asp-tRNA(Asn)/Glu-tRNA(Gln) amidotransferase A subunit family amidase